MIGYSAIVNETNARAYRETQGVTLARMVCTRGEWVWTRSALVAGARRIGLKLSNRQGASRRGHGVRVLKFGVWLAVALCAFPFPAKVNAQAASSKACATTRHLMTGVNLVGAALNPGKNAKVNFQYVIPTRSEIDYFVGKGLNTFRISVLSSRLIGPAGRTAPALTPDGLALLHLIDAAQQVRARIIVDFHEYGIMRSGLIGRDPGATSDFAQAWGIVAGRLKDRPNVIFGLMNEPHAQTASEWLLGANAAIAAIRAAGATQLILVPGSYWSAAQTWTITDNSRVMLELADPRHNFAYELHQYLDSDGSGVHPQVVAGAGAARLVDFTLWARRHHVRGFLGEFGFAATPDAMTEGRALVRYMAENSDVWSGWTYWAAGPWWGDYMFTVEPGKAGDRAQLGVLTDAPSWLAENKCKL